MKTLFLFLLLSLSLTTQAQTIGYVSLSTAYVPMKHNTWYLGAQLTVGIANHTRLFAEFNQTISITSYCGAAKLFQVRVGRFYRIDRGLTLHPFIGYSLTSAPINENRKVGHGGTAGIYMLQAIPKCEDMVLKFELSVSNSCIIIPSIGILSTF